MKDILKAHERTFAQEYGLSDFDVENTRNVKTTTSQDASLEKQEPMDFDLEARFNTADREIQ